MTTTSQKTTKQSSTIEIKTPPIVQEFITKFVNKAPANTEGNRIYNGVLEYIKKIESELVKTKTEVSKLKEAAKKKSP